MALSTSMLRQSIFPNTDLPLFTTEASESVLRLQASNLMRHPFAVDMGNTLPWGAEPGAGKSFLESNIVRAYLNKQFKPLKNIFSSRSRPSA